MAASAASAGRCRPRTRSTCRALTGVTLYEPEELVLTAKAGTPLAEIEAMLAERNQELAFEPMDYGPLLGQARAMRASAARSAACWPPTCPARAG